MTLTEKAAMLLKLKERKSRAEARLKVLKGEEEALEQEIFSQMINDGFEKITVNNHNIAPELRIHMNYTEESRVTAMNALKEHGFGWLVVESTIKRDFNGWAKEQMEAYSGELPQWILDNFNIYQEQKLSVRKNPTPRPKKARKTK